MAWVFVTPWSMLETIAWVFATRWKRWYVCRKPLHLCLLQVRSETGQLVVVIHKGDRTHVEDVKDPVEVQFPGPDRILIARRMDKSRDRVSLALLDDIPLNLRHSPAIKSVVSELPKACITGLTYVVNCPIASHTD